MMDLRSVVVAFVALLSAVAAAPAQQGEGPRIALVIGNSNYPDADAPLKQPVQDARALADELKRNGFEVDVAENLTKEAMRSAIDRLYGKLKPAASVVLFFSGYGIQTGRQTYLIPVNAQIWTEAEVRRDGIGIDTILAELNARGANVKLAIIDASRRNPFERRFRGVSTGLAPVTAPRGTLVISAAAPGTVISDNDEANSLFVRELLKEMRSPNLTVEEVFNRTRIGVSRASKGEQVPWISSSLVEDFYLGKPGPRVADRDPPTTIPQRDPPRDPPRRAIRRESPRATRRPTCGAITTSPSGSVPARGGTISSPSTSPGPMWSGRATSSPSSTRRRPLRGCSCPTASPIRRPGSTSRNRRPSGRIR